MLKVTKDTQDLTIEALNRDELRDVLVEQFDWHRGTVNKWCKGARVGAVKEERDKLIAQANAEQDDEMTRDRSNPLNQEIREELVKKLEKLAASYVTKITEFQTKLTQTLASTAYEIEWHGDDIQVTTLELRAIKSMLGFAEREAKEPSMTLAQFVETIQDMFDSECKQLIEYSLTERDVIRFKGMQFGAKLHRAVLRSLRRAIETLNVDGIDLYVW